VFAATEKLGAVRNDGAEPVELDVPPYVLAGGSAAVRAHVAWNVGGALGAEAGWLVSAFVGSRAMKRLRVRVDPDGAVEVDYRLWTAAAA
jgi:hypothetical protein